MSLQRAASSSISATDEMRLACQCCVKGDYTVETKPAINISGDVFWQKPYPNKIINVLGPQSRLPTCKYRFHVEIALAPTIARRLAPLTTQLGEQFSVHFAGLREHFLQSPPPGTGLVFRALLSCLAVEVVARDVRLRAARAFRPDSGDGIRIPSLRATPFSAKQDACMLRRITHAFCFR